MVYFSHDGQRVWGGGIVKYRYIPIFPKLVDHINYDGLIFQILNL